MTPRTQPSSPWWSRENQLALAAAPQHLPPRPSGRPVSVSRVYAYCTAGVRGVRLRRFRGPGGWCTTIEELERFLAALNELAGEVQP